MGARIRALRTERGLSLSALAAAAGIGKGSLSELESGRRNPTLDTLYAVAGPLGVPLAVLLDFDAGAVVADEGFEARRCCTPSARRRRRPRSTCSGSTPASPLVAGAPGRGRRAAGRARRQLPGGVRRPGRRPGRRRPRCVAGRRAAPLHGRRKRRHARRQRDPDAELTYPRAVISAPSRQRLRAATLLTAAVALLMLPGLLSTGASAEPARRRGSSRRSSRWVPSRGPPGSRRPTATSSTTSSAARARSRSRSRCGEPPPREFARRALGWLVDYLVWDRPVLGPHRLVLVRPDGTKRVVAQRTDPVQLVSGNGATLRHPAGGAGPQAPSHRHGAQPGPDRRRPRPRPHPALRTGRGPGCD